MKFGTLTGSVSKLSYGPRLSSVPDRYTGPGGSIQHHHGDLIMSLRLSPAGDPHHGDGRREDPASVNTQTFIYNGFGTLTGCTIVKTRNSAGQLAVTTASDDIT